MRHKPKYDVVTDSARNDNFFILLPTIVYIREWSTESNKIIKTQVIDLLWWRWTIGIKRVTRHE